MQISCPKCKKTFNLEDNLIPDKGRLLQCGKCKNKWFYKKKIIDQNIINEIDTQKVKKIKHPTIEPYFKKSNNIENNELNKVVKKKNINFIKLFLVTVISFVAILILIDTFKLQISKIFPQIEFILYNLYETLNDIYLFIKDFIN
tara:strand:- start:1601 stop:2035 length:435 start_codon:yes stop_codon:yes gene_type:complete